MAYISSNENRFYVALENSYGLVSASSAFNRIPAIKLTARQQRERVDRKDKTGSRTFVGYPPGGRLATTVEISTYMRNWADQTKEPGYGPLFQACMGLPAAITNPLNISSITGTNQLAFATPHGLTAGQGVVYGSEIRFVTAIVNDQTIQINAPFTVTPANGASMGISATYSLDTELNSVTILDCWSPTSAVQRMIYGLAIDRLQLQVNADFYEFQFAGAACDVADTTSFQPGQGGLTVFPAEPSSSGFEYSIVPGHLGDVWLGNAPNQFFTLTSATVTLNNDIMLRDKEFGAALARGISPGMRNVSVNFSLYQQDDSQTQALYQAARQQAPTSVMLQMGRQAGQLTGVYLKSVMLETPEFDDSQTRQQWTFKSCRAQGVTDDEISIAFG
jgi:hypothetical protein